MTDFNKPPSLRITARDEVGELWLLADECREWAATFQRARKNPGPHPAGDAFRRLAEKLDDIAKRLAAMEPKT